MSIKVGATIKFGNVRAQTIGVTMPSGFVYVMANAAMPGLVKIGKTTRDPAERAAELSAATGVAAPFIVVFEQLFTDCDRAEDFVHAELERRGTRPGPNREFFRATPNDVIRVILEAPGTVDGGAAPRASDMEAIDSEILSPESADISGERWIVQAQSPWGSILEEADKYYYGYGSIVADHSEALSLYKQAAKLGSLVAFEKIAEIYYDSDQVKPDLVRAMQYLREGIKRGNYYCHARMARLLYGNGRLSDAKKAHDNFFVTQNNALSHVKEKVEPHPWKYVVECSFYIADCFYNRWNLDICYKFGSLAER